MLLRGPRHVDATAANMLHEQLGNPDDLGLLVDHELVVGMDDRATSAPPC